MKTYKSVCRICHGGCGAILFVEDGKLARVKPDPDSPFSRGRMCIKGLSTPEMMYHPERVLHPLKRDGKRGENKWRRIEWDTALSEIADRLDLIRRQTGPESVAVGQGTGRHHFMHVIRFANAFGTPNWYEPGLANCFIPRITVSNLTYGGFVVADYYGKVNPQTILFWGHNPVITGPDGEIAFPVRDALKAGSFGIAVDPRRSETAKRCNLWLPIRPGTDCALALAMIHVIIYDQIFDRDFVEKWTEGFERLKKHVKDYTPQWAEAVCGVKIKDIVAAARRYAVSKPSVLEWGVALEQNANSLQTVRAVSILRGLTRNIDIPGGDIFGMQRVRPYPVLRDKLPKDAAAKRIGGKEFKLLGGFRAYLPSAHVPGIFHAMRTGDPYPIRALLNFGSNPLVTVADSRKVYDSLLKLELMVVADMFMTPTASLADYVLPAAFWPEVDQIIEIPYVAGNAVMAQQKVVQVGACRPDEEILNELAKRLDLPGSEQSLKEVLDYRLEPFGITFDELKQKGMVAVPHQYWKYRESGFKTPSKKVELYSRSLERMGYAPMPTYSEPPESPVSTPDLAKGFPYVLTTGARRNEFFHSEHRQIHSLRKRRPFPLADIHPNTAAENQIGDGDWMYVSSPRGRIKMKAHVTDDIKKGVVNIDHGWWFPEKKQYLFGVFDSNANVLTSDSPPYDPAFGSYPLRGGLCSIQRIMEEAGS